MKTRSTAFLLITALVAVPALTTATPLVCRVQPLTDTEYLALQESVPEEYWTEVLPATPTPSRKVSRSGLVSRGGPNPETEAEVVPAIGNEKIAQPAGCPDINERPPIAR
ncbi:hypothetical protein Mco01_78150 [Microbispora corallina]|uniref:Secreted protein n=1 Tax=Microbispora corallina TaxID=83302 RepID=A0ABQ4GCN7_9ACTN|nr:hypothetical protein Mco01_78150 [Microbispora corallina]